MTDGRDASLWEELKEILRLAAEIFGEPARLLEDVVLPSPVARRLRGWLNALETVARALLLLIALRMPPPPAAVARRRRVRPKPAVERADPDDLANPGAIPDSAKWADVVFHVVPRVPSGGRGRGRAAPPRRFMPVRALAYRLEALIRVAEAPEPFARRLARRLAAAPGLTARVLHKSAPDTDGRPPPWDDLVDDAAALAWAAARDGASTTA